MVKVCPGFAVLDELSRPSAPQPARAVQFPASAAGRHLIQVHDHFRADLDRLREVLAEVRHGAMNVSDARSTLNLMALRANDWVLGGYCQAHCFALTQHHTLEDGSVFGHLRSRQPDLGAVLDQLSREHLVIHDVIESLDAALVHLAAHPTDFAPVTDAVDMLTDALLSHFAYEERELVAPLSRFGILDAQS